MANATTWTIDKADAEGTFNKIINHLDDEMNDEIFNALMSGKVLDISFERTGIYCSEHNKKFTGDINEPVPFLSTLIEYSSELDEDVLEAIIRKLDRFSIVNGCICATPFYGFSIQYPVPLTGAGKGTIWNFRLR